MKEVECFELNDNFEKTARDIGHLVPIDLYYFSKVRKGILYWIYDMRLYSFDLEKSEQTLLLYLPNNMIVSDFIVINSRDIILLRGVIVGEGDRDWFIYDLKEIDNDYKVLGKPVFVIPSKNAGKYDNFVNSEYGLDIIFDNKINHTFSWIDYSPI